MDLVHKSLNWLKEHKDALGLVLEAGGGGVAVLWIKKLLDPWGHSYLPAFCLALVLGMLAFLAIVAYILAQWRKLEPVNWLFLLVTSSVFIGALVIAWPRLENMRRRYIQGYDVIALVVTMDDAATDGGSAHDDDLREAVDRAKKQVDSRIKLQGLKLHIHWDPRLMPPSSMIIQQDALERLRRNECLDAVLWVEGELESEGQNLSRIELQTADSVLDGHREGLWLGSETGWDLVGDSTSRNVARDIWDVALGYVALFHYGEEDYAGAASYMGTMSPLWSGTLSANQGSIADLYVFCQEPYLFYALLNSAYELERFDLVAFDTCPPTIEDCTATAPGLLEEVGLQRLIDWEKEADRSVLPPYLKLLQGKVHVRLGDSQHQAEAKFREVIGGKWPHLEETARNRLVSEAMVWWARALSLQGETAEAEQSLHEAQERDEGYWLPHLELGRHYLAQGEYDQALSELEEATTLNDHSALAHTWQGIALYMNGDRDGAEKAWGRAKKLGQRARPRYVFLKPRSHVFPVNYGPASQTVTMEVNVVDLDLPLTEPSAHTAPYTYTLILQPYETDVAVQGITKTLSLVGQSYETTFDLLPFLEDCRLSLRAGRAQVRGLYGLVLQRQRTGTNQVSILGVYPFVLSADSLAGLDIYLEGTLPSRGMFQVVCSQTVSAEALVIADLQPFGISHPITLTDSSGLDQVDVVLDISTSSNRQVEQKLLIPTLEPVISFGTVFSLTTPGLYSMEVLMKQASDEDVVLTSEPVALSVVTPTPPRPAILVRVHTDSAKGYSEPVGGEEILSLRGGQLLLLLKGAEAGRAKLQLLTPGRNTLWTDIGNFTLCQSLDYTKLMNWNSLAVCHHDDVVYALEEEGEMDASLGRCYSDCEVFEVREIGSERIHVRGSVGSIEVEGWVRAEDMDVYELKDLDLDW
ncbi:MAG: tetratricopeptide repeat protein [Chloroflexi bacterium]|nr:tetratricopeptide repeat protein [Chloroflexota bacterium]